MKIPGTLTAGDSYTWKDDSTLDELGNTIDSSWTLKYIIKQAAVSLTLTASTDAPGWSTTISKTQSETFAAGKAYWQAYAEKGSDRKTLGRGEITFLVDITTVSGSFDGRSQAKKDLDAVQLAMRGIFTDGIAEYTIMGRQLKKIPLDQLITMESKLKFEVSLENQRESIKNGLGNPRISKVRFR